MGHYLAVWLGDFKVLTWFLIYAIIKI
jgi:hypothetical protein